MAHGHSFPAAHGQTLQNRTPGVKVRLRLRSRLQQPTALTLRLPPRCTLTTTLATTECRCFRAGADVHACASVLASTFLPGCASAFRRCPRCSVLPCSPSACCRCSPGAGSPPVYSACTSRSRCACRTSAPHPPPRRRCRRRRRCLHASLPHLLGDPMAPAAPAAVAAAQLAVFRRRSSTCRQGFRETGGRVRSRRGGGTAPAPAPVAAGCSRGTALSSPVACQSRVVGTAAY